MVATLARTQGLGPQDQAAMVVAREDRRLMAGADMKEVAAMAARTPVRALALQGQEATAAVALATKAAAATMVVTVPAQITAAVI